MNIVDRFLFSRHLEDGEQIQYIIHQHWVKVYRKFSKLIFIGLFIPLGILFFFVGFQSSLSWFMYIWIGIAAFIMAYDFLDWYGDAWVLTNERIIDVRWDGFFDHSAITLDFHNMLDVEYEVKGIEQRVMGYGTLSINKYAGNPIEVKNVARPRHAANMIGKLRMSYMSRNRGKTEELKQVLSQFLQDRPAGEPRDVV